MKARERVRRVIDGDTFETEPRRKVRLADVDAPEATEPGGAKATAHLKELIEGKIVSIETIAEDIYWRNIAEVKVRNTSVNQKMRDYLGK